MAFRTATSSSAGTSAGLSPVFRVRNAAKVVAANQQAAAVVSGGGPGAGRAQAFVRPTALLIRQTASVFGGGGVKVGR